MPFKSPICGIYSITTPSGSSYVGSSYNIKERWAGHRYDLRRGKHHSQRLQGAWNKYGEKLVFSILQECQRDSLNVFEQEWINRNRPVLNTSFFVSNVWATPSTRNKLLAIYQSEEFSRSRSEISSRRRPGWVPIESSDGICFLSMAYAAQHYGVRTSGIFALAKTQRVGKLGVRFKFACDLWRNVISAKQQRQISNAGFKHSKESREKMSKAKRGIRPMVDFVKIAIAKQVPIIRTDDAGQATRFPSVRLAANEIRGTRKLATVSCQISKCIHGVKRSAYGYRWTKSERAAA